MVDSGGGACYYRGTIIKEKETMKDDIKHCKDCPFWTATVRFPDKGRCSHLRAFFGMYAPACIKGIASTTK